MSITTIARKMEWDMGHRLESHRSKCKNLHGHRYTAEIILTGRVVSTSGDPERGMVADFDKAKELLACPIGYWDHGMMISTTDPWLSSLRGLGTKIIEVEFTPTAENIAKELFTYAAFELAGQTIDVVEVAVWETPSCKAVYRP